MLKKSEVRLKIDSCNFEFGAKFTANNIFCIFLSDGSCQALSNDNLIALKSVEIQELPQSYTIICSTYRVAISRVSLAQWKRL
jgi:hypothetical protein